MNKQFLKRIYDVVFAIVLTSSMSVLAGLTIEMDPQERTVVKGVEATASQKVSLYVTSEGEKYTNFNVALELPTGVTMADGVINGQTASVIWNPDAIWWSASEDAPDRNEVIVNRNIRNGRLAIVVARNALRAHEDHCLILTAGERTKLCDIEFNVDIDAVEDTVSKLTVTSIVNKCQAEGEDVSFDDSGFALSFNLIREKLPVDVVVNGPAAIATASTAAYTCMATWNDETTSTVTPTWSLSSTVYAAVSPSGVVTNKNTTTTDQTVTLTATYTTGDVTCVSSMIITLEGVSSIATQTLSLEPGWNWVGFNVLPESRNIGDVLGTAGFTANDIIQTNGGMARFTGASWMQGSFSVEFGRLYQIYVNKAVTVTISGEYCEMSSVPLVAGWNWIGNPTAAAITPADLTHSGGWAAGDRIQSSDGAVTYTGSKWIPADGLTLASGKGCQIFTANEGTLTFNALYAVVDLSGGPDAASYPVRYTDMPPNLNDDTCRTTELWLRKIPAGTFIMGSPEDELGRVDDETQHQVTLTQNYYIGVFECTQRQWELVMAARPSYFINEAYYKTRPVENVSYDMIRGTSATAGAGWPTYGHAVDADSFMGKLREKTGLVFDLPTEAQWEYACRAGTTTALNSGKNLISISFDANMNEVGRYWNNGGSGNSQNCDPSYGTAKVGSYLPNAWGLYDMHGNVFEWCLDWSGSYGIDAVVDPLGLNTGSNRVLRGGRWDDVASSNRSASRGGSGPSYGFDWGVRIVLLP